MYSILFEDLLEGIILAITAKCIHITLEAFAVKASINLVATLIECFLWHTGKANIGPIVVDKIRTVALVSIRVANKALSLKTFIRILAVFINGLLWLTLTICKQTIIVTTISSIAPETTKQYII